MSSNVDLSLAALGLALTMITWGLDKMHFFENHPNWGIPVGAVYLAAGVFWLIIAIVVLAV